MGSVRYVGVEIACDKCHQEKTVSSQSDVDFYREFSERKDKGQMMAQARVIGPAGDLVFGYEILCPECDEQIREFFSSSEKKVAKKRGRPKKEATADQKKDDGDGEEIQDEKPEDVEPGAAQEQDEEVDDDQLFD
jgi:hypothetical protein